MRELTALQQLDSFENALREAEPSALYRLQQRYPRTFDPEMRERGFVDPAELVLVLAELFEELVMASSDESELGFHLVSEEDQFH